MELLREGVDYVALDYGMNFAYNIDDSRLFQMTEYKMLTGQDKDHLIRCMRVTMNGKVQLFYLTQGYRSLSSLIPDLSGDQYCTVATNIIDSIIEIKNNGFLSCCKIVIDSDRIYVDPNTLKVGLIYLPLAGKLCRDEIFAKNALRNRLVKCAKENGNLQNRRSSNLCRILVDGTIAFEDIPYKIPAEGMTGSLGSVNYSGRIAYKMIITTVNESIRHQYEINKDEYIIGKSTSGVDGHVDFNKYIGRMHCRINRKQNQFFVTDLDSKNGTFVNGRKIVPLQAVELKAGDQLRLANSDFSVAIV